MKIKFKNLVITGNHIMYLITIISIISSLYLGYLKYTRNTIDTETFIFSIFISLLNLYLLKRS